MAKSLRFDRKTSRFRCMHYPDIIPRYEPPRVQHLEQLWRGSVSHWGHHLFQLSRQFMLLDGPKKPWTTNPNKQGASNSSERASNTDEADKENRILVPSWQHVERI